MRHLLLIIVILNLAAVSFAQKQTKPPTPTPTVEEIPQVDENQEFQNARAHVSLSDKINALVKFTKDFPESELRTDRQFARRARRSKAAPERQRSRNKSF